MRFLRRNKANVEESEQALKEARQNLKDVQERTGEVKRVAKALKDIRERNHFAEQMEEIIIRRRGSLQ